MLRKFLSKPKKFCVSLESFKEEIDVNRGETILTSGLNNGLVLPQSIAP